MSQPNIAYDHFPEEIMILNSQHLHGAQFIKTIDADVDKKVGMTFVDEVKDSSDYYALPNQSFSKAEQFLKEKDLQWYEMGFGLQTPARVNSGSQQAFRDSVSSADAILATNTASDRKLEKKREAEISIRSSLSEAQENFFKKMQRENKVVSDNLSMELSDALSKCEDTNNLLSTEKGKSNIKEAQHKKDIEL